MKNHSGALRMKKRFRFLFWIQDFSITSTKHKTADDLVHLKYDKKSSPLDQAIVQECNGLVVDVKQLKAICVPPKKFFQHNGNLKSMVDEQSGK